MITISRLTHTADTTIGFLRFGDFSCFTLEDAPREKKIPGKTRIPAGEYKIGLRTDSPKFAPYYTRFPWHKGMLWLQDVPDFQYVYLHIGNSHADTDGCLLVGMTAYLGGTPITLGDSATAYRMVYQRAVIAMADAPLTIRISDETA